MTIAVSRYAASGALSTAALPSRQRAAHSRRSLLTADVGFNPPTLRGSAGTVLILDDQRPYREVLRTLFESDERFTHVRALPQRQMHRASGLRPQVILIGIHHETRSRQTVHAVRRAWPTAKLIAYYTPPVTTRHLLPAGVDIALPTAASVRRVIEVSAALGSANGYKRYRYLAVR